jgi:hypothetical protein
VTLKRSVAFKIAFSVATSAVGLAVVLVLLSLVWGVFASASALASGSPAGLVPVVLVLLGYVLAAGAIAKFWRSKDSRSTWIWATAAGMLVLAASLPALWTFGQLFLDEWCEYQPGGRGHANISSLAEIPFACR